MALSLARRREAWDPFRELEDISNRMTRLLGLGSGEGENELLAPMAWAPSCDIVETDKEYRIRAALPNVKREDVHVTLQEGVLSLRGERREEKEEKNQRVHRREISYGSFQRRFNMPADADASKVDASFKDGVLDVTIGKSKSAESGAREINIH